MPSLLWYLSLDAERATPRGASHGDPVNALGIPLQLGAEVRVGDADHLRHAFAQRLAAQVGDALFGHDEVDEAAVHGDWRAFRVAADDARVARFAHELRRRRMSMRQPRTRPGRPCR